MTERKLLPDEAENPVEDVVEETSEKEGDEVVMNTEDMPKEEQIENDLGETKDLLPEDKSVEKISVDTNDENMGVEEQQSSQNEVNTINDLIDAVENEADNPIQSDKDFVSKPKEVEFSKLFEAGIIKPLEKIAGQKNLDDMVIETIVQSMLASLYVFKEWAEQRLKNIEEAQKKTQENREKAIQEALKSNKTSYGKMAAYIAIKTDEFLRDNSSLYFDEKGMLLPYTRWSKEQKVAYKKNKARYKLYYQKYQFAKRLDRINNDPNAPFDFTKLSNAQKRKLNFYINLYATQNPTMRKYVEKMAEVQLHESEYKQLGKLVNYALVQRAAALKANQPKKIASQELMYTQQVQNVRAA